MPKNNGVTVTYAGHAGVVTNAVDEQFELDPTRDLEGKDNEGLVRGDDLPDPKAIDGPDQVAPSENTDAAQVEQERKDENEDESGKEESEEKEEPSAGSSSKESSRPPVKSVPRTSPEKSSPARPTANR